MGLDIDLRTDNPILENAEWDKDFNRIHSLSRTFCNLIRRRDNLVEEPELEQISRLTGVDIAPLYEMDFYRYDMNTESRLYAAENETEKQMILQEAEAAKGHLAGNIDRVQATVEALLSRLPNVDDLPGQLSASGFTKKDYAPYFSDSLLDTGDGYIGNNFGQDLRNFSRYLHCAKNAGSNTVFFGFG